MTIPKVSVVITSYNYGRFLADAVNSVAVQTCRNYEIIIVDDGSTDDTREVAENLIRSHPDLSIKLVSQENKGAAAARNAGITSAQGEYIVSLDGDDMIKPEFLEETVNVLDNNIGTSIAYTAMEWVEPDGRNQVIAGEAYDFPKLIKKNLLPSCNLFRKKAWQDAGGYKKLAGAEDWELWIAMGEIGHYGKLVNKPLFVHRVHGDSKYCITNRRIKKVLWEIRSLHAENFCPRLSRISVRLARFILWIRYFVLDPPSHFLYTWFPRAHSSLRKMILGSE